MSHTNLERRTSITIFLWSITILCAIIALFLLMGMLSEQRSMSSSITTQGIIIDEGTIYRKGSTAYVVVQFSDMYGTTQTETIYESDGGFSSHFHDPVGQTIPLSYVTNHPDRVEIGETGAGKAQTYLVGIIISGLISLTCGVWATLLMMNQL